MRKTGLSLILSVAIAALVCVAAQAQGVYTTLHEFAGGAGDGREPYGSLILNDSTLYGMTVGGGVGNNGVIFAYNTVPEPGSFLLFGAGLLSLLGFIRRGRRKGLN